LTKTKAYSLALAGIFTALIFIATYFLRIPASTGYIHLGDGVILLAVMWMGRTAAIPAAVGSALVDLFSFPVYAPGTLVIKTLMALTAAGMLRMTRGKRTGRAAAFVLAEAVMVAGYFLYDALLYGVGGAFANLGGNAVQAAAGVVLGLLLSALPLPKRIHSNTSI